MRIRSFVLSCLFLGSFACNGDPGGGDTGVAFPAIAPDVPQVVHAGGPVLVSPEAVVVSFAEDTAAGDIEAFVSSVGATGYWRDATSEYGVGSLSMKQAIHVPAPAPSATSDAEIQDWLYGQLDGAHSEWPLPNDNTLYVIFYPATTSITYGAGTSCHQFGGYHGEIGLRGGRRVPYAVIPRCTVPGLTPLQYLTSATSHELIEAATDPFATTAPAYGQLDAAHLAWMLSFGQETADLCDQGDQANVQPTGFSYTVQRNWSNLAARAGSDPCIPAVTAAGNFNVSPLDPTQPVSLDFKGTLMAARGFVVPPGTSRDLRFTLYSDSPNVGSWTIAVPESSTVHASDGGPALSFVLDRTGGQNGDVVTLRATSRAAIDDSSGVATVSITSTQGDTKHVWLGLIATGTSNP